MFFLIGGSAKHHSRFGHANIFFGGILCQVLASLQEPLQNFGGSRRLKSLACSVWNARVL